MSVESNFSFEVYTEKDKEDSKSVSISKLEDIINYIHPDDFDGDFLDALVYNIKLNYILSIDSSWKYSPLEWTFDDTIPSEIEDDTTDIINKLDFFNIDENEKQRIIKEFENNKSMI